MSTALLRTTRRLLCAIAACAAVPAHADEPLTSRVTWEGAVGHSLSGTTLAKDSDKDGDVDGTAQPASFAITSSDVPAGATLVQAILYWGGGQTEAASGPCDPTKADTTVSLGIPDGSTLTVTASSTYCSDGGASSYDVWMSNADVTTAVEAAGGAMIGTWTVSNYVGKWSGAATDNASAALLLVYQDSSLPPRRVVLYDGIQLMESSTDTLSLTGFDVDATPGGSLTFYGLEGDIGGTGTERITVNGTPGASGPLILSDAINPADNPINRTINTTTPTQTGVTGVDIDKFDITSALTAYDSGVDVIYAAGADKWWLAVNVIGVDQYDPSLGEASTKTWALLTDADGDGEPSPGDTIRYTIHLENSGNEPATVDVTDTIPAEAASWTLVDAGGGTDASKPTKLDVRDVTIAAGASEDLVIDVVIGVVADGTVMSNTAAWGVPDEGGSAGEVTASDVVIRLDADGDGYYANDECDDAEPAIHPGATELCNGEDDDCDGLIDDGATTAWYRDADGDGYGDAAVTTSACAAPSGYVANDDDCDDLSPSDYPGATEVVANGDDEDCDGVDTCYTDGDLDGYAGSATKDSADLDCADPGEAATVTDCNDALASVNPGATEVCNGVDDDCDGAIDDGVKSTWYRDADGDGYGSSATTSSACAAPSGYVADNTDCDDLSDTDHPGATEVVANGDDEDCDGGDACYKDGDKDTYGTVTVVVSADLDCVDSGESANDDDCDDTSASDYPGAPETIANGDDEDCDGVESCYADGDKDGYGTVTAVISGDLDCTDAGESAVSTDCNDAAIAVNPGATEVCNGIDDDCDGFSDDGTTITYYRDADGDGYGNAALSTTGCAAPTGYVSNDDDCDDASAADHPGATEAVANGDDEDCDGKEACWTDADADKYGTTSAVASADLDCTDTGESAVSSDCDDGNLAVNPAAVEICNGIDDDCDGATDESVTATYYRDADGDGFGAALVSTTACAAPTGYVSNASDCDDTLATVRPGATEACNGIDDDCDGTVDEGVKTTFYRDADGDGYGTSATPISACAAPSGYVAASTDCDDTAATRYPGATESCNGIDDDCDGAVDESVKSTYYLDADSDGYGTSATATTACAAPSGYVVDSTDCDDSKATVYPGAPETCNGIDDDCDGTIDEGVKTTWYRDLDGDGYGRLSTSTAACTAPTGYVATSTDCDDTRASVNPGATELCNLRDDDCDGSIDEDSAADALTWYRDGDGDGYGDASSVDVSCTAPTGFVAVSTDCDDTRASVFPGATEVCNGRDDDCDGATDDGVLLTWYVDGDADGYGGSATTTACTRPTGYVSTSTDCDDAAATVNPGAAEACNGIDDDCDLAVDEGVKATWYRDADGDGYGWAATTSAACTAPSGYVADKTDCDDTSPTDYPGAAEAVANGDDEDCDGGDSCYADADKDAYGSTAVVDSADLDCADASESSVATDCDDADGTTYPGATEICDGIDNDCDGSTDEGATGMGTWYLDGDADGYGSSATSISSCSRPTGYVNNALDCDDAAAAVNPAATERCNGIDDDCDGSIDESSASDALTWYDDDDGDGYGDLADTTKGCTAPSGYVATSTDCDDALATVNPAAIEACNGIDDDCDGTIDESVKSTFYADADGDGYGWSATSSAACSAPSGYVADATDCDDAAAAVNPGADEACNGVDDDCDGDVDEDSATDAVAWYLDADADGYGDPAAPSVACDAPLGHVADATDCDDTNDEIRPGAPELCNAIDDDCDGLVDEGGAIDAPTWYADADSDGYGDLFAGTDACEAPAGAVADATDCDDADPDVNPGEIEVCNGTDDDCDGTVDEPDASDALTWYADADADAYGDVDVTAPGCDAPLGYVADSTDCDDAVAAVNPGAVEVCNDIDDDCDGAADEGAIDASTWYADADDDGYGDVTATTDACDAPTGAVSDATDCDDADATAYPGAPEVAYDGIDQDCDGADLEDVDGDGYAAEVVGGDDCDDGDETVYPGAGEAADGRDGDCDGTVDETTDWYDDDGDGYAEEGGDCDDADPDVSPAAEELCDGVDEDCDGAVDDGTECYDDDGDGVTEEDGDCNDGDAARFPGATESLDNGVDDDCDGRVDDGAYDPDGDGYTAEGGDCGPDDGSAYPGAPETADGVDDDCDGVTDEGTEAYDDDGDGLSELSGDCDDADADTFEGADEIPGNGRDDDCDGLVDEGSDRTDDDGDGWTEEGGDCDDSDAETSPTAEEIANGADDDCDGLVDEGFVDVDGDGYTIADGDCDDLDGWVHPGGAEVCDDVDNDCNGAPDDGCIDEAPIAEEPRKCGCGTGSPGAGLVVLIAAFAIRRRRPSSLVWASPPTHPPTGAATPS